eukprot:TRINITY_DN16768_c0_g1_i1.p1 TRINITY_DN16768_c0_g1~~TRINITY_DN16768_c0_g1_i1.p1  ORF type:complete len:143 (-),score=49.44 TRINITY_DN16768_c0_g1_i1:78-473(-)
MNGDRDTEIAMGAYEPVVGKKHKKTPPKFARGDIHKFRMSLWAEHLNVSERQFLYPESDDCARRVREIGAANWKQYSAPEISTMTAHLMTYPLAVDPYGKVTSLSGSTCFPDTTATVIGFASTLLPDALTK